MALPTLGPVFVVQGPQTPALRHLILDPASNRPLPSAEVRTLSKRREDRTPAMTGASATQRWAGEAPLRVLVGPYIHGEHCAYMDGAFDDSCDTNASSEADLDEQKGRERDEHHRPKACTFSFRFALPPHSATQSESEKAFGEDEEVGGENVEHERLRQ